LIVSIPAIDLNGVDLSANLLAMSRTKFHRIDICARLAFADIRHLPYPNEQFDLAVSGLVLEHVAQPLEAVREMARVLRGGGTLVVVATRSGAPDFHFRWKYRYTPYSEGAVVDWMKTAGLANVQVRSAAVRNRSLFCAGVYRNESITLAA
jgi:ubiquinone/menaquinone biosynthesis C-methylase UbiE